MSPRPVLGTKRRATGPRTPEGRKRAAQNARRHGLTSISPNHAAIAAQVDDWIEGVDLAVVPLASLIRLAEVRFRVAAVRDHQAALLEQLCGFCDAEADQECTAVRRLKSDHTRLVQQYQISLRYRAEAEAQARKALRHIADQITASHATAGT